jgi:hypothetical protein
MHEPLGSNAEWDNKCRMGKMGSNAEWGNGAPAPGLKCRMGITGRSPWAQMPNGNNGAKPLGSNAEWE